MKVVKTDDKRPMTRKEIEICQQFEQSDRSGEALWWPLMAPGAAPRLPGPAGGQWSLRYHLPARPVVGAERRVVPPRRGWSRHAHGQRQGRGLASGHVRQGPAD